MTANNMGNILFLKGDMEGSAKYYERQQGFHPRRGHMDQPRPFIYKGT